MTLVEDERRALEMEIMANFRKADRNRKNVQAKNWREKNIEKHRAYMREYMKNRYWAKKTEADIEKG